MNYYVYILANDYQSVLYVGVTNDLRRRIYEHKYEMIDGFTKKYHVHNLLYYEETSDIQAGIFREKQIKKYSRKKKYALIDSINPKRKDLYDELHG